MGQLKVLIDAKNYECKAFPYLINEKALKFAFPEAYLDECCQLRCAKNGFGEKEKEFKLFVEYARTHG